ncbi:hypothetical protein BGZ57DRAFT_850273 [Hyaloscypha finlandica]|nr:hypothetical protein BGZ57DRAFT_850273 [Hyaloscypha finlandica]
MWALHQAMLVAPAASLLVYPRLCGLTTRRPPRTGTGRQQRDCCASQKASADDYLVGSQVSRRISGQSKRDRADLRQRSRSMTTAFQANSLAPMGWNLEPESKIDRHHHCSTSIVVWTDSCTRLFGPSHGPTEPTKGLCVWLEICASMQAGQKGFSQEHARTPAHKPDAEMAQSKTFA